MDLRTYYESALSARDYKYFHTYSDGDRSNVIEEAKDTLHAANVKKLRECMHATNITKLLGILAHEVRTPLHAIVGTIDLMQGDTSSDDRRLCIRSLEQGSISLQNVMNRLQDLEALLHDEPGSLSIPLDIAALMTGVGELQQASQGSEGKGSQLDLELDPRLPLSVEGDLTKIQQIMNNLVTTAVALSINNHAHLKVDFIDEGPTEIIRVTLTSARNEPPPPLMDGIGLQFTLQSLLRPSQTPNMYQGLVFSREFLILLGSKLSTSWRAETGIVRFSFDLRLKSPFRVDGLPGLDNQSNYGSLVKKLESVRVLLVEDNAVNMSIAITMLKKLGFNAESAENGLEAISKLHQTEYDIILMDCDMPVCNGYDATKHIRTRMKNDKVIIIALTADSTNAAKSKCIAVGMNDYFTKPITTKTLEEMLYKWLKTDHNDGEKRSPRES